MVRSSTMLSDLAPDLIRGLPLYRCLGHGAHFWKRRSQPMRHARQKQLTKPTKVYHHFFSHDWGTWRWLKFFSLLIHFNSRAATVATLTASTLVGILSCWDVLPQRPWTTVFGYLTFFTFLTYWQSIRASVKPTIVFLDKLCIFQDQEELKKEAIYGLASFLDRSEELLVLWSSQYLRRLWCTFEVATFLRHGHKTKKVTVLPVQTAIFFTLNFMMWFILQAASALIVSASWDVNHETMEEKLGQFLSQVAVHLSVSFTLKPAFLLLWVVLMKEVAVLPAQLETFQIQKADCFCCSVNHKTRGEDIPCDRQLIYGVLEKWYTDEGEDQDPEGHLELFNHSVRRTLAQQVVRRLKNNAIFAYHLGVSGVACSLPWLSILIPYWVEGPKNSACSACYITWLMRDVMNWLSLPLTLLLQVHLALHLAKRGVDIENWLHLFVLTKVQTLISILIWLPCPLSIVFTDCCNPVPIAFGLLNLAVNLYLYRPRSTMMDGRPSDISSEMPQEADEVVSTSTFGI